MSCEKCKKLLKSTSDEHGYGRLQGQGNCSNGIMIVLENPCASDIEEGTLLSDTSGKFIKKQWLGWNGIAVSKCRVVCAVQCRTLGNAKPSDSELRNCREHLVTEINKYKPRVIVTIGSTALKAVMPSIGVGINAICGTELFSYEFKCSVFACYTPAYINELGGKFDVLDLNKIDNTFEQVYKLSKEKIFKVPTIKTTFIDTEHDFLNMSKEMLRSKSVPYVFDIETTGLDYFRDALRGVAFSNSSYEGFFVPISVIDKNDNTKNIFKKLLTSKNNKIAHNCAFDVTFLNAHKYDVSGVIDDTMLMHYLLDENSSHSLDFLSYKYTNYGGYKEVLLRGAKNNGKTFADMDIKELGVYSAMDAAITHQLYERFKPELEQQNLFDLYNNIMLPCRAVLNRVTVTGLPVSIPYLIKMQEKFNTDIPIVESVINIIAKKNGVEEINVGSQKQVAELLYDKMHLPCEIFTTMGKNSVNDDALNAISKYHPLPKLILLHRGLSHDLGLYVTGMLDRLGDDKRLHPSFKSHGTVTGRLCVSGDTELVTDKGTFAISDIMLTKDTELYILTHTGKHRRILNKFYKGYETMYNIRTKSGKYIKCTAGHRLLTVHGWVHAKDIIEGSKVITVDDITGKEFKNKQKLKASKKDVDRGIIQESISSKPTTNDDSDKSKVRNINVYAQKNTQFLQTEIFKRIKKSTSTESCKSDVRKRTRKIRKAVCDIIKTCFSRLCKSWSMCITDCKKNENNRIYSKAKYRISWLTGARRIACEIANYRFTLLAKVRGICTQYYRECETVLRQPTKLLCKIIQSVFVFTRVDLVYARTAQWLRLLQRIKKVTKELYYKKYEQSRGAFISVFAEFRYRAYTAILFLQTVHSRFLYPTQEFNCGSAGGVSYIRYGYKEERCSSVLCDETKGLQTIKNTSIGCVERCDEICADYTEDVVESITCVGVCDVWDIEVEIDHSYVAQGLVHHNSSTDPNGQNFSRDSDIRNIVEAPKGYKIIDADFSQIEVRVLAHYSQEPFLIDVYKRGEDVHGAVTAEILGTKDYTKEQRSCFKQVVFGITFGMEAKALSAKLFEITGNVYTVQQAQEYIDLFLGRMKKVSEFINKVKELVHKQKYVVDLFGKRRRLPTIDSSNRWVVSEAERQAVNCLMQGTASYMTNIAMVRIEKTFIKEGIDAKLILTVHDSIMAIAKNSDAKRAAEIMKTCMEADWKKYGITLPIVADVDIVTKWGEKKESSGLIFSDIYEKIDDILKPFQNKKKSKKITKK